VKRHRLRGSQRGLTLIELLLTMTILALAGALVSGALGAGLRAWQQGLNSGREELVARIVVERIATQLRAAVGSPVKKDGEHAVAFDAGEEHLRFVTIAAGQAPVQVSYGMQADGGDPCLVYREFPWPDKEFFGGSHPRREERIVEVTGFAVSVVARTDESDTGETDGGGELSPPPWSPTDGVLPASVSVAITVAAAGAAEPRQYQVTVPIPTRVPR